MSSESLGHRKTSREAASAVVFVALRAGSWLQGTAEKFRALKSDHWSNSPSIIAWADHRGTYPGGPLPPTPKG